MGVEQGIVGGMARIGVETRTLRTTRRGVMSDSREPLLKSGLGLIEELGCVAMSAAV